jgi:hypothetical protein
MSIDLEQYVLSGIEYEYFKDLTPIFEAYNDGELALQASISLFECLRHDSKINNNPEKMYELLMEGIISLINVICCKEEYIELYGEEKYNKSFKFAVMHIASYQKNHEALQGKKLIDSILPDGSIVVCDGPKSVTIIPTELGQVAMGIRKTA